MRLPPRTATRRVLVFMRSSFPRVTSVAKAMRRVSPNVDSQLHRELHGTMNDRYQAFTSSSVGQLLVKNLGLPDPPRLERYAEGDPLVKGTVALGGRGRLAESLPALLDALGVASSVVPGQPAEGEKLKALVFDATGLTDSSQLGALQEFFSPKLRSLENNPRVVVLGTPPEQA